MSYATARAILLIFVGIVIAVADKLYNIDYVIYHIYK